MGKKGKRSKQKDAKKEADKIIREYNKLMDEGWNNETECLFSKAANQYRQALRLLESKKELMVYTRDLHLSVCDILVRFEYQRRNYKAALDCYNYFITISRHLRIEAGDIALLHQLVMLRLNGQECQITDFIDYISQEEMTAMTAVGMIYTEAIFAFRTQKQFDSAIRLEMTCGSIKRNPFKTKLSLALTYLEQYRLDFHKRSQTRKTDFSTMNSLITSVQAEYPVEKFGFNTYYMVLSQWYYLTHTLVADKSAQEESITRAIKFVDQFLYSSILATEGGLYMPKMKQDCCYTCGQTATSTEVQYICSGCRVACYCSIDHQRNTWKKEAVRGMRIGHEILCPLYKAYRKYKLASEVALLTYSYTCLDRECVRFLEYGLGLKNKCFPYEYQSM